MADVFDIDSDNQIDYYAHHNESNNYNRRNHGRWIPVEINAPENPRLKRDNYGDKINSGRYPEQFHNKTEMSISPNRKHYSYNTSPQRSDAQNSNIPHRMAKDQDGWHSPQRMQYQPSLPPQNYQQPPPPPMYQQEHYNSTSYPQTSGVSYPQNYGYGQQQQHQDFNQYGSSGYPQQQGYSADMQGIRPPGEEYPGGWAPVTPGAYSNMSQQHSQDSRHSTISAADSKKDSMKKEAAIANEMKQQQATLLKQRDDYMKKASVLRRELEKLRVQKHELLSVNSPPRDGERILRENAKLQLEIQNKLESIHNVVDMLSGIIGDELKMKDTTSDTSSPMQKDRRSESHEEEMRTRSVDRKSADPNTPYFNYIHYDPEMHWCRVCDVFPRSAKDFLNHLHSAEHRQVTQEHQLVDTPWHKLPADEELPSFKGAPVKRVPIKGLQFFISATSWYCKLCDSWIGDLHCASLHLKSKNHSHNYSNFIEQNPHWETNWIKDRERAFERCGKLKLQDESHVLHPPGCKPESPHQEKLKMKRKDKLDSLLFDNSNKDKKRKKKSKKRKKRDSSGSSSSSSSSDTSSEEDSDKSKSIRVAMRNKMRMQAQLILKEEVEGKLEALGRLVEEDRWQKEKQREVEDRKRHEEVSTVEDNIINQWMTVNPSNDRQMLEGLKGRLKQRQEQDKERAEQAAAEQRKRERQREEKELKEMREREQREREAQMKEEQENEEHEQEERERAKERERDRRRHRSDSENSDRMRRSRSRSVDRRFRRKRERSQERNYRKHDKRTDRYSPDQDRYKPRRSNYDEDRNAYESYFEKQTADSAKSSKEKKAFLSNRKLPFIGRMPLFKKKNNEEEKEIKKEDYDIRPTKFEAVNSVKAFIPAPGVVHIAKLAAPNDPAQMVKVNAENPPPPPIIIPEPPNISDNIEEEEEEEAPPPPTITVQEVDDEEPEPEVQAPPPAPDAKPKGGHLPRDFQDALNIIYPGDQRPDMLMGQDPSIMMQYQYGMGYGMMYPGMQMYDYSVDQTVPAENGNELANPPPLEEQPPPPPPSNDNDDLAMLGIDAEDMAAQTI